MPRYAIISDIHSNLEALDVVADDIRQHSVDIVVCLGDIVGYGADPQPCVRMLRNLMAAYGNQTPVMGNHDNAVANGIFEGFSGHAKQAIEWTRDRLTKEEKSWLGTCPFQIRDDNVMFVHASPYYPQAWHYIVHVDQAQAQFNFFNGDVCFIGHTHRPFVFQDGETKFTPRESHFLSPTKKTLVNVGSVGQPRDEDNRASYVIYDRDSGLVTVRRLQYDYASAAAKIIAADLPEVLAKRLYAGR